MFAFSLVRWLEKSCGAFEETICCGEGANILLERYSRTGLER